MRSIARFLLILNSSVNPLIYVWKNDQFRDNISNLVQKVCPRESKSKGNLELNTELKSYTQSFEASSIIRQMDKKNSSGIIVQDLKSNTAEKNKVAYANQIHLEVPIVNR